MLGTICAFLFVFPGDIGGQMGLFIGASILTILELFDYLYEVKYLFLEYLPSPGASHLDKNIWCSILFMEILCCSTIKELLAHKIEFSTQCYPPHKDMF